MEAAIAVWDQRVHDYWLLGAPWDAAISLGCGLMSMSVFWVAEGAGTHSGQRGQVREAQSWPMDPPAYAVCG